MSFDEIVLLPEEEKLLREMLDDEPREMSTPNISNLRAFGLLDMSQQIPSPGIPYKMQYGINRTGRDYLRFVDAKNRLSEQEKDNSIEAIRIAKEGVAISKIAAIAAIISAVLSAVAIVLSIVLR
jgi:hypothetical protein